MRQSLADAWRSLPLPVGLAWLLAVAPAAAEWVAVNDHYAGAGTSPNATLWNVFGTAGGAPGSSGVLKNITNGAALPAALTITNLQAAPEPDGGAPAAGTPAYLAFTGLVDFGTTGVGGTNHSVQLAASNNAVVAYVLTGLDPAKRYSVKATAVRGVASYTNRWTLCELGGARCYAGSHSAGVLTSATVPALAANQAAFNSGDNASQGNLVFWDGVTTGSDGQLVISARQYTGTVPGGSAAGPVGYGLTALRVEEMAGETMAFTLQPSSVTVTQGYAVTLSAGVAGCPPYQQWFKNSAPLAGATNPSYLIARAALADAGVYQLVISNATLALTSAPATVTFVSDATPPVIVSVSPTNTATNVSVVAQIRVVFNEPIDPTSLTVAGFQVRSASNTPVAGAVTYDPASRMVTFSPVSTLLTRMTYTATVGASVTDLAGNPMGSDYVWSFTTSRLYEPDIGTLVLSGTDDGSTTNIPLPFAVSVYAKQYTNFWINNNGNVTFFPSFLPDFTAFAFPNGNGVVLIAPFFADVDTRSSGGVYYKAFPDRVVITWDRVGFYVQSAHPGQVNTFQLIISAPTASGNLFGFSYDDMQWTTGDFSGGSGGFGGSPARAGFDAGDGTNAVKFFEGTNALSLLDLAHQTFWYLSWGGPPRPNEAPVANAGLDQTLEQTIPAGAPVVLDGSGSTDDGLLHPLSFTWTVGGTIVGVGRVVTNIFPWGTNVVMLTVDDGQFTNSDTATIVVRDTTAPDTLVVSGPAEGSVTTSRAPTFGWSGTDNGTYASNLLFSFSLDGGAASVFSNELSHGFSGLADGSHTLLVAARDQRGNTDGTPAVRHFTLDATPPVMSNIVATPALVQCTITWQTDEPARYQIEYGLSASYGSVTPRSTPLATSLSATLVGLTPGTLYHYRIHVFDALTNEGVSGDLTFTTIPDTTPPDTSLTAIPASVCALPVTFSWSGSDNVTAPAGLVFAYRLDGQAWSAFGPTTSLIVTQLADGPHLFEVKARDVAGNEDASPASGSFTLNTLPPVASSVVATPAVIQCAITWNTDEAATARVEYGLTASYGNLTALQGSLVLAHTVVVTNLSPTTTYHFRVRSQDGCGHELIGGDQQFTTLPDTTPPDTTLVGVPATQCALPFSLAWTGSDDVTPVAGLQFAYRLDGQAWSTYALATSVTVTQLTAGAHTVEVKAKDAAGNEDASPASRAFTLNLLPPVLTNLVVTPSVTGCGILWDTDAAATAWLEYGLTTNYGTLTPTQTSLVISHWVVLTNLPPVTTYHFRLHSADVCGHEVVSADRQFTTLADTAPPDTTLGTIPAVECALPFSLSWSGVDDASASGALQFAYRLDGLTWSAYAAATSVTMTQLANGQHTFEVKARDAAGNEDPTPASRSFIFDSLPPVLSNLVVSPGVTQCNIRWDTDELATTRVEYGLTTSYGSLTPLVATLTQPHQVVVSGLQPVTLYHFRVHSQDACGHELISDDRSFTTLPDTTLPDTSLAGVPATECSVPFTLSWTGSDDVTPPAGLQFAYHLDGQSFSAFGAATSLTVTQMTDGVHTITVKARDAAGNQDATPAVATFTVDTLPPVLNSIGAVPAAGQCQITWGTSEPATAQVEYGTTTNYGTLTVILSTLTASHQVVLTGLTPVLPYHYRVRSKDGCGHEAISPDFSFTTVPDTTAPDTTIAPPPTPVCTLPAVLSWSGTDDVTPAGSLLFAYRVDGQAFSAFGPATSASIPSLTEGSHTLEVKAQDAAGNVDATPASRTFVVNTAPPQLSAITAAPGPNYARIQWRTDEGANARVEYGPTAAYGQTTALVSQLATNLAVTVSGLQATTLYHFRVISQDVCGHQATSGDLQFTTLPAPDLQVVSVSMPADTWTGSAFDVTWVLTNAGPTVASGPWLDRVYLSSDNQLQLGVDRLLGEFQFNGTLEAGRSVARVQSVSINRDWIPSNGNYRILVMADAANDVFEGVWETNNVGSSTSNILVRLTPLPDLVSDIVQAATNALGGQTISLSWTVCNQGEGATDAPQWSDRIRLYRDAARTELITDFGAVANASYLAPGECYASAADVTLPAGIAGWYYLFVEANSSGEAAEVTRANNSSSNAIFVTYVAPAFLHVESVVVAPAPPTAVWGGDRVTVTWTVRNTGASPVPQGRGWDHAIGVNSSVLNWHRCGHNGPLMPGDAYTCSDVITVPDNLLGTNIVYVYIDPPNWVPVPRDQGSAPIIVALPPPSDLEVTSITAPTLGVQSQTISLQWTVANNGLNGTRGGHWTDAVYLGTGQSLDQGTSWHLGTFTHWGDLQPGDGYGQTASVTLPAVLGTNYLFVYTDSGNTVYEGPWETNNLALAPQPIFITNVAPPSLPDLRVTSLSAPYAAVGGQNISVSWSVANSGVAAAGDAWKDAIYLSADTNLNLTQDILLGVFPRPTPLAVGGSYSQKQLITLPNCPLGSFYLIAVADAENQVVESTEGSANALASTGTMLIMAGKGARLQVSQVTAPDATVAGQPLTLSWTVINQGSGTAAAPWTDLVYLSAEASLNPATGILFGAVPHGAALSGRNTYTAGLTNVVPRCLTGAYYAFVVTDASNQVNGASCETNNVGRSDLAMAVAPSSYASLQVRSISVPPSLPAGATVSLTWVVTNAGTGPALGNWNDTVYLSASNSLAASTPLGAFAWTTGALSAGGCYTQHVSVAVPTCLSGGYYICVVTDTEGRINSGACVANNALCVSVPVLFNSPDLQFVEVNKPQTVTGGTPFALSWTVANSGPVVARGPWKETVYLSADTQLSRATDTVLANVEHAGDLGAGSNYVSTANVTLPPDLYGSFYVIFETDAQNLVPECQGEANNVAVSPLPLQVNPAIYPDILVTAVSGPSNAYAGQILTVSWTVANQGTLRTPDTLWYDAVYLSKDQVLDVGLDAKLAAVARPQALGLGEHYTQSAQVTIPRSASGPYYLIVVADSTSTIFEFAAENNNISPSPAQMFVTLAAPADLSVTNVVVTPATGLPDGPVHVSWTVRNLSTNDALGQWTDTVYLSTNTTWDYTAVLLGRLDHAGGLAPLGSYSQTLNAVLPALTPGSYYALVRTDIRNNVRDVDRSNNTEASSGTILADVPELVLGTPRTNSLHTGTQHYYKVRVAAGETLAITLDSASVVSANQLFVLANGVPDLGHYDQSYSKPLEPDQKVTVPSTVAGWYYVLVRGENVPDAPAAYSLTAVTIPFGIVSVAPTRIGDFGQITLTLSGSKFQAGATVTLVQGTNRLTAALVRVLDGSQLKARFFFTNAPRATYDLVLRNADGAVATLAQSVTIEAATDLLVSVTTSGTLTPRAGGRWDMPCVIFNIGNIDVPYLAINAAVRAQVHMGWVRPADSLPRQTDYPDIDWLNSSPTAGFADDFTRDCFWVRDFEAGQQLSLVMRCVNMPAGPFDFRIGANARTADDVASGLAAYVELLRQAAAQKDPSTMPTELVPLVTDPVAWQNRYRAIFAAAGLVSGNEAGWHVPNQDGFRTCGDGAQCWSLAVGKTIQSHFDIIASGTNFGQYELLLSMADMAYIWHCTYIACQVLPQIAQSTPQSAPSLAQSAGSIRAKHGRKYGGKPDGDPGSGGPGNGTQQCDPNEKVSPAGTGEARFLTSKDAVFYTIHFENLATANATTRRVTVSDPLDANLDIRSFRLVEIGFNKYSVVVPANRSFYATRVPLDGDLGSNIVADISAGLDLTSGRAIWTITAIDLSTGEMPLSSDQGILPPNTTNHVGEGYVTFTIKPRAGLATGAVITNQARIVFEENEPIDTNPAWNTLDALPPISAVEALPAIAADSTFGVTWSGHDETNGSGVRDFDLYVSEDNGAYGLWLAGITNSTAAFTGVPGHQYRFYSVARDNAGNLEAAPSSPDAVTYISTNRAPTLAGIGIQAAQVGGLLVITNQASDPDTGEILSFALDEAPVGARITSEGVFQWYPRAWQAGTTNAVTIRVTDNGVPPRSASQTFLAVVSDYVQPDLGTVVVRAGQPGCLPITLMSSVGLTNVTFRVTIPTQRLTNLSAVAAFPEADVHLFPSNAALFSVRIQTLPEESLKGTQQVAVLCFNTFAGQSSGVASIVVDGITARAVDGSILANVEVQSGRVIIVADKPLLEAGRADQGRIQLNLYGNVGQSYQLQSALSPAGAWVPGSSVTLTNLPHTLFWTNRQETSVFFRLLKQ